MWLGRFPLTTATGKKKKKREEEKKREKEKKRNTTSPYYFSFFFLFFFLFFLDVSLTLFLFHLVLDYFAISNFYDRNSNNEIIRMQQKSLSFLKQLTGFLSLLFPSSSLPLLHSPPILPPFFFCSILPIPPQELSMKSSSPPLEQTPLDNLISPKSLNFLTCMSSKNRGGWGQMRFSIFFFSFLFCNI